MTVISSNPRSRLTVSRTKPSLDFSVTGLVYCAMMMFLGLAAVNSQANVLFMILGLMVGVLLISGVISKAGLRKLSVRREVPEHGIVGQRMPLQYIVENRKRFWPSVAVTLAEVDGVEAFTHQPQAYLLHLAPRSSATIPTEPIAKRRGIHHLKRFQIISSFPFGFIRRAVMRSNQETVLIFPAIGKVSPRVLQMCRSAETAGAMMRPRRGGTDEFYGVKEYRRGENQRWIYWRRSARTGNLVTKEMTHVSPPRIMILLDTFVPDQTLDSLAAVERAIAMAASLIGATLEQGLPIGIIAWSDDGWVHIPANRGKRHRLDLLTLLSRLPLNRAQDHPRLLDESRRHVKSGTTSILMTPKDLRLSLGESARGSLIVFSSISPGVSGLFSFESGVDFTSCIPLDHALEQKRK